MSGSSILTPDLVQVRGVHLVSRAGTGHDRTSSERGRNKGGTPDLGPGSENAATVQVRNSSQG